MASEGRAAAAKPTDVDVVYRRLLGQTFRRREGSYYE
jgi:hypothetical protein